MFSYKIGAAPTQLWEPGMPVPMYFQNTRSFRFAAFNAAFDQLVINVFSKKYGFGKLRTDQMVDVMAIAARYGLPQSLGKLGKALDVKLMKIARGTVLKNKICSPNKKGVFEYTKEEFQEFREYCIRDTDSMDEIIRKLPASTLSDNEQKIWEETAYINARGVPIDAWSVSQIQKIIEHYTKKQEPYVGWVTKQQIQTVGQTDKIKIWCAEKGVELPNLQVQTVAKVVDDLEGEEVLSTDYSAVLELLKLRQLLGGAAHKKFKRLFDMTVDNIIYDNLRYHGAGTGRTTGGGFQLLNLPRAKVTLKEGQSYNEAVIALIAQFFNLKILKHSDPLGESKKLVRPMIKAPKKQTLLVADWGSIEYILLMYYAGEWEKVEKFRNGNDPYIDFATELFHVAYADVTDQMRQEAKPPVLGSGYMLGSGVPRRDPPGGLIGYALGYGVVMTDNQAEFATNTYRNEHPRVKASWYALKNAAIRAIKYPGIPVSVSIEDGAHSLNTSFLCAKDRTGRSWLILTLPSGRQLYYCEPWIAMGKYGEVIKHKGVNPDTKQWGVVYLKPQRIIENIIQGLGRDILQECTPRLRQAKFNIVLTVYDEVGCVSPVEGSQQRLREMEKIMCIPPSWMPQLPLRADGYISKRYKKA
ncbi:MAG: hypothetical protein DRJ15_01570 [Bacteroidetes bacterium]|nr:MAG: hypothetical protein DRJ15_01570 [Bacteroidota bacterium]